MSKYDIDYSRLAVMLLPTFLRKPLMSIFTRVMVAPVASLHAKFATYMTDIDYRLKQTGQVCRLQGLLNDQFDYFGRRIRIFDMEPSTGGNLIYLREDAKGIKVPCRGYGAYVVPCRGYTGIQQPDFMIWLLPGDIDIIRLTAIVNRYKLAGKRFIITQRKFN